MGNLIKKIKQEKQSVKETLEQTMNDNLDPEISYCVVCREKVKCYNMKPHKVFNPKRKVKMVKQVCPNSEKENVKKHNVYKIVG